MSPLIPLYIVLGAAGSGRREIVLDLIKGGLLEGSPTASVAVTISEHEKPTEGQKKLSLQPQTTFLSWSFRSPDGIVAEPCPVDTTALFFLTDGRANPVDQIEALKNWIEKNPFQLARIITVVDCQLGYAHPQLQPWFEACIHFSDMVLLNKQNSVPPQWIKDFQQYFKRNCYPCLFESVKNGSLPNPAQALYPEPRRLSLIFDYLGSPSDGPDPTEAIEIISEGEEDGAIEELESPDPYLEKDPYGRRTQSIPDIRPYLEAEQT